MKEKIYETLLKIAGILHFLELFGKSNEISDLATILKKYNIYDSVELETKLEILNGIGEQVKKYLLEGKEEYDKIQLDKILQKLKNNLT